MGIRDMIEHWDDYAAGKGRGPADRLRDLDPWRKVTADRFERGSFTLELTTSFDAAVELELMPNNQYIRRLLFLGMVSRIRQITKTPEAFDPWFADILARKPNKLAAVAMANKTVRIIWAVLTRNESYKVRTI